MDYVSFVYKIMTWFRHKNVNQWFVCMMPMIYICSNPNHTDLEIKITTDKTTIAEYYFFSLYEVISSPPRKLFCSHSISSEDNWQRSIVSLCFIFFIWAKNLLLLTLKLTCISQQTFTNSFFDLSEWVNGWVLCESL